MKCVVACCWPPDKGQGISTVSREIAEQLVMRNHEVYYLSPEADDKSWYEVNSIKKIANGPDLSSKEGLVSVVNRIKEIKPDVIINNDHPYVQAALPVIDAKKIIVSHTMAWATSSLVKYNHQWADKIIAISYDMLHRLITKGVPPEKLVMIMNGVKDPYESGWMPTNNSKKYLDIVFAGNWTKVKGADLLVESISSMPSDIDWLRLNCFGSINNKYKKKISNKSWINVHGRVSRQEFLNSLSAADILLFPSRIEGCPMTVIEAMSYGVIPVVSDGLGAMRWMIDHGINGFVCRSNDWKSDMWGILNYLNEHRNILVDMKQNARLKYKERFDVKHMINTYINTIDQIEGENTKRPGVIKSLHWHRPMVSGSITRKIIDRLFYRMGVLRVAGNLKINN